MEQSIDDAAELQEELAHTKQTNEQLITELKEEALSYQEKLSQESTNSKSVADDRELLKTQIVELRKVSFDPNTRIHLAAYFVFEINVALTSI